jgi:tetratricopeptide (TPR) repeat protein
MAPSPRKDPLQLPELIHGRSVGYTGRLGLLTHEDFIAAVEAHGGHFMAFPGKAGVVVLGEEGSILSAAGGVAVQPDGGTGHTRIFTEQQFIASLGLEQASSAPQLYSATALCELLDMGAARLRAWTTAGLITPSRVQNGVGYFSFSQVATAKTLSDAMRSGVKLAGIRKALEQLRTWMPDAEKALNQLTIVEQSGSMLIRLEDGELADTSGQFHFDFTGKPQPLGRLMIPGLPSTAEEWFWQGVEQEEVGHLAAAEESYRQALRLGGIKIEATYNLANVLMAMGEFSAAVERYRQVVEIDPHHAEAWNNLGLALVADDDREEACGAFREAIAIAPSHLRAHYNLADTLDELGRCHDALVHWEAHARLDPFSEWGRYARTMLA